MTRFTSDQIRELLDKLQAMHPVAECELQYTTPFELLVAVILSAQCTDRRVNAITPDLFAYANTPEQFAEMCPEDLEQRIYSCGFYHNKARNIIAAAQDIVLRFDGKVPDNIRDLMTLAGVGRKTANVVYAVAFGGQAIAVDTHVLRLANRIGLAHSDNPLRVEQALMQCIPQSEWAHAHHLLIHHGRYVCTARSPHCDQCTIRALCQYYQTNTRSPKE